MDEAERCHRLAYIAYGSILASGTPDEVIAMQNLVTWAVSGEDIQKFSDDFRNIPGVGQVATFGSVLHVSSEAGAAPGPRIADFCVQHGLLAEPVRASLEDVFIRLMGQARDPLQPPP